MKIVGVLVHSCLRLEVHHLRLAPIKLVDGVYFLVLHLLHNVIVKAMTQ